MKEDQQTSFHKRSFHYPTYHEIMTEVEKLKADVTRMLTREQFIYILNLWFLHPDIKHELKLAFQVFDTEKRNYLEIDEIRSIVKDNADVFDEIETMELIRDANVSGSGNVCYEDFVESIFRSAPELCELKADHLYDDPNEDPSIPPDLEPVAPAAVAKNTPLNVDDRKSRN
ncbi:unnamed protein product [Arctia plantaginis]|uniref:EF-hand domain-containing protein n=1 Tax=Arctia plantaginis TaxID=874455 RepID=A0A8S1B4L4_ARCPL|nr:unnamed protein product [Arctia plantaginis]CAB3253328.1 unnamed protein product [Arctia plantaginis]